MNKCIAQFVAVTSVILLTPSAQASLGAEFSSSACVVNGKMFTIEHGKNGVYSKLHDIDVSKDFPLSLYEKKFVTIEGTIYPPNTFVPADKRKPAQIVGPCPVR